MHLTALRLALRFNREALLWAVLIFIIEALIATVWSRHRWLRSFGGDALAAVWVYFAFKTVVQARAVPLALAAFATGCAVELAQLAAQLASWTSGNPVLRTVLGSVPDWMDVLAYAVGAALVVALERLRRAGADWFARLQ